MRDHFEHFEYDLLNFFKINLYSINERDFLSDVKSVEGSQIQVNTNFTLNYFEK